MSKTTQDSGYAQKLVAELQAAFDAADQDKDGLLSEKEYIKFMADAKASAIARGGFFPDYPEEAVKEMWKTFNYFTPEKVGITMDEMSMGRAMVSTLMKEF